MQARAGGLRRDLRLSLGDAAGYGLMAGVGEVYIPAFGLALGLPPVIAGLLASVPLLAGGVLQLAAPRAIQKVASLRGWVVGCVIVQALAFVPLILVALARHPASWAVFAAASVYWAAGMGATAGWTPWMSRVVPARLRARFFGRRQGLAQAAMLLSLVGAGAALQAVPHAQVLRVYAVMFSLALVARLGSALAIAREGRADAASRDAALADPTRVPLGATAGDRVSVTPRRRMRFRSIPPKLRGSPRAALLGYLVATGAAAAVSGPFITPYVLAHTGLGYVQYGAFTAAIVIAKVAAMPLLGRAIARLGLRRVLGACALGIVWIPLMYLASDAFWWLLVIQLYGGVVWGGFELGTLMTLFDADDDAERTTMQVAFSALNAVGTAGASLVGGALLAGLGADGAGYAWLFVASFVARFAAAVVLIRELPRQLARLPIAVVSRAAGLAWTVAIRPWGGTIVRPLVESLGRLRDGRR